MLSEWGQMYLGWFAGIFTLLWMTFSRRIFAWIGATVVAAYLAIWGGALSDRRAANFVADLSKRVVFITGCDSGFGLQLAMRLNAMGVIVYAGVFDEKGEGAKNLKAQGCKIFQIDVTKDADVKRTVDAVKRELGDKKLHALVNNAGVCEVGQVEWCGVDVFLRMLQVNTLGVIRVTQAFLPLLRMKRGTRIVNTASVAGRYTLPGFSPYSVSKHALVAFSDGLRKEMKPWKISVHMIQPTSYTTPLSSPETISKSIQSNWDKSDAEIKKSYGENYYQTFKSNYLKGVKALARKNTSEVVDDMIDALLSREPKINYIPSLRTKLMVHVMTCVPTAVQDFVLNKRIIPDVPPAGLAETLDAHTQSQDSEVFV